jgi:membrane-associated phospholipid phosphatase
VHWLQTIDLGLFRFINTKLANPLFDRVMPFVSGNSFFYPMLLVTACVLIWKGRVRGLLCVVLLALILPMGDTWICRTIKKAVARPRPFVALADVHRPGIADSESPPPPGHKTKPTASGSMPSSHAANWFAATMIGFIYYRRSLWILFPAALLVSFSRIYNGVHYPSDVLAGAILGAGYGAAAVWSLDGIWQWAGRKWFPLWWEKFPSLITIREWERREIEEPEPAPLRNRFGIGNKNAAPASNYTPHIDLDAHWLRLGYLTVGILLFARLLYIYSDIIQLTGDEAYQWLWSKHLALSYYSKPPLIAYAQFLGTAIFGDTAFGVRFFSPVCAAILSIVLLRFFAAEFNARAGFFLLLMLTATPLVSAGAVLMTVDPFSVLFWSAAMVAGWRAVQLNSPLSAWAWAGLWMGLGFLSKYTALAQWVCWAVFFLLWKPARAQLRRPGIYLALLINVVFAVPVLIWNQQHGWITVQHVAGDAKAGQGWSPAVLDFLASEALLLNPVFFVPMIWAAIAFWRRSRHNPKLVYLFSMGAPLFLGYFIYSFHSRLQPNWIAPSVLPLFALLVAYGDTQWRLGTKYLSRALIVGLALGLPVVIIGHQTELIGKFTGHLLPVNQDPLHRARGWTDVAGLVAKTRTELLFEGKPVFIIAAHYRLAGELSFYLPEARQSEPPLVYCRASRFPVDQFYFWPGYSQRKGENAIFVLELDRNDLKPKSPPPQLAEEFESVTDLGIHRVLDHGRVLWPLQLFACRNLK